jgi:glycosyltransferase involved in cell wall biosynthesis
MLYRRPIEVIPNPIPNDVLGVPRTPSLHPTILDVADSGRLKNVASLLRAAASVRRHIPTLEVRLVGPGLGAEDAFAAWARERSLATGVRFLGALDRTALRLEYSRAWLFVHASLEESFGMSVLEAASAGLPVVAGRRTGGIPYVLGQGRAGWLADVGNPESLAAAIRPLLMGHPPTPKPGTWEYLEKTFGPSRVAEQYVQWYQSALGGETPH